MTLDKHTFQGITQIIVKTLPTADFEQLITGTGYTRIGFAPVKGDRVKVWWSHSTFSRLGCDRALHLLSYYKKQSHLLFAAKLRVHSRQTLSYSINIFRSE